MNKHKYSGKHLPEIKPEPDKETELVPHADPGEPVVPAEARPQSPAEMPPSVSPYDFPPPGEGVFPEIFSHLNNTGKC